MFKFLKKKKSMDELVEPSEDEMETMKRDAARLKAQTEAIREKNQQKADLASAKKELAEAKRESFSYTPTGRAVSTIKTAVKSGTKGWSGQFSGFKKGLENNLNFGAVDNFSMNPRPQQKRPETIMVKVGKNTYKKVKVPQAKQRQQSNIGFPADTMFTFNQPASKKRKEYNPWRMV